MYGENLIKIEIVLPSGIISIIHNITFVRILLTDKPIKITINLFIT